MDSIIGCRWLMPVDVYERVGAKVRSAPMPHARKDQHSRADVAAASFEWDGEWSGEARQVGMGVKQRLD
jgi:hypothetical protein